MRIKQTLVFIFQSVLVGLAAAAIILILKPDFAGLVNDNNQSSTLSYGAAVNATAPAVVNVYASKVRQQQVNPLFRDPLFQRFFGRIQPGPNRRRDSNLGSGVIMNPEGYILTNAHLIQNMDEISVTLNDGRKSAADIIGVDPDTDLAVLRISLEKLPVIPVGDSDKLAVGDVVLAIGNPFDFGQAVTQGIVSAMGRKRMGITTFEDFIQTDADINPGNSGGALITANGQLIGINTAIISNTGGSQGFGLATPINLALDVMHQLINHGSVVRGWLGIEAQILPPDISQEAGLKNGGILVAAVLKGGPAHKAGIMPGDIIMRVDGHIVSNPQQAIQMISRLAPGSDIDVHILRGWEQITLKANVAERPSFNNRS